MTAPQSAPQHRIGDRFVAEVEQPPLTLTVSYNAYQRWTVVIIDRTTKCALVDLHEESTLAGAQRYAEGYVRGFGSQPAAPIGWVAKPQ